MLPHEKINYVEWPSANLSATKAFFQEVFSWKFTDYGPEYTSFNNEGVDGGFYAEDKCSVSDKGGALVVFYSKDLAKTLAKIQAAGGTISKPIFNFPGGARFHFTEPSGNEFAVWSDCWKE